MSLKAKQLIVIQSRKAGQSCMKHKDDLTKLHDMILKEYGVSYNAVDCDPLIDECEVIGGNGIGSVAELDEALYGYSNVPKNKQQAIEEMGEL